ncbi:uncharacterized protein [Fopius arisanus]|uniref:Odorant receptor n=2 Tax=Fopius arisanus TaxID=64838 RepID=A0A9R1TE84_9HYME|nr:PREDICTED: uncharacterized protein LOC105269298 [Fopius arisanus]
MDISVGNPEREKIRLKEFQRFRRNLKYWAYVSGSWPLQDPHFFYRALPFLIFFSNLYICIQEFRFVVAHITNIGLMTGGFSMGLSFCSVLVKVGFFRLHRVKLIELHAILEAFLKESLADHHQRYLVLEKFATFQRLMTILCICVLFGCGFCIAGPLIFFIVQIKKKVKPLEYILPSPATYPWTTSDGGLIYLLTFIYESYNVVTLGFVTIAVDGLFEFYIFSIIGQFKVLGYRISNLTVEDNPHDVIRQWVKRCVMLKRCSHMLQTTYGPIILWQVISNSMIICMVLFQIMSMTSVTLGRYALTFGYTGTKIIQTYIYSWAGSSLTAESEALTQAAYSCNWQKKEYQRVRTSILIILTQKPLILVAVSCVYISLDMFLMTLNTALSYFFLLQTFDQKASYELTSQVNSQQSRVMGQNLLTSYTSCAKNVKHISIISGIWPSEKPNIFYKSLPYFIISVLLTISCATMNFAYVHIHNINSVMKSMSISLSYLNGIMKVVCYLVYRQELKELNDTITELFKRCQGDDQLLLHTLSRFTLFKVLAILHMCAVFIVLGIYCIMPIIIIIKEYSNGIEPIRYFLPYPAVYPYDVPGGSGLYVLHYAIQGFGCFFLFSTATSIDSIFAIHSSQIIGQLRALSYEMRCFTFRDGYEKYLQELVEIHRKLIRCCKLLEVIHGPIVLSMVVTTAIILCCLIFQISQMATISLKQISFFTLYMSVKLLQTWIYALAGTIITTECDNFRNDVYGTRWENSGKKSAGYHVSIILMQRSIYLKACNYTPISMNLFTGVVLFKFHSKKLFKVHTILVNFHEKSLNDNNLRPLALEKLSGFRILTQILSTCVLFGCVFCIVGPLLFCLSQIRQKVKTLTYILPTPAAYPWHTRDGGYLYALTYIYEAYNVIAIVGQLRVLDYQMRNLKLSDSPMEVVREWVEKFLVLRRCCKVLQRMYGPVSGISIGRYLLIFGYSGTKIMQTYLYSWAGSTLTVESEAVTKSVYSCNWERSNSQRLRTSILIILTQKPLVIVAAGCVYISLDMFLMTLNTAVSYFFLLQTFEEKAS